MKNIVKNVFVIFAIFRKFLHEIYTIDQIIYFEPKFLFFSKISFFDRNFNIVNF